MELPFFCGISATLLALLRGIHLCLSWVHQNRASPFASDFHRRLGYHRDSRNGNQFCLFESQRDSPFASDFWSQGDRTSLRAKRLKKFKIALRDWNFQARLKISSEPPTKPRFLVGIQKAKIENFNRDWIFQARLKISSVIDFLNLWALSREEHSMDQCWSRLKLSENFERHWSIRISGETHMDQWSWKFF